MKHFFEKKYFQAGLTLLTVAFLSIFFCYIVNHWEDVTGFFSKTVDILAPIIDGLIIAFLLIPVVNFIEHRLSYCFMPPKKKKAYLAKEAKEADRYLKGEMTPEEQEAYEKARHKKFVLHRSISIIITLLFVGLLIYSFLYSVVPQIKESLTNIAKKSQDYYNNYNQYLDKLAKKYPDIAKLVENNWDQYKDYFISWRDNTFFPALKNLGVKASSGVLTFLSAVWDIIIGLIISVYILASKERFAAQFKKVFYGVWKTKTANTFIRNIRFVNEKFSGFIVGKLVDSLIIGVICLIFCYILKFDYPVLISVIIGVTNIIPFFGPIFGAIPCFILLFMISPIKSLYFIVFVLLLQQFDGNILGPKILGSSTGVSGLWVIFSITLFGGIWGVPGMIIGVPLFAVLYAGVKTFIEEKLNRKEMPTETKKYLNLDYIDPETMDFVKHESDYQVRKIQSMGEINLFKKFKKKKQSEISTADTENTTQTISNEVTDVSTNTNTSSELPKDKDE